MMMMMMMMMMMIIEIIIIIIIIIIMQTKTIQHLAGGVKKGGESRVGGEGATHFIKIT